MAGSLSQEDRGFQRFFDKVRYKCNGILQYGCVFGQGFVLTGGIGKPLVLCCHYLSNVFNANAFGWFDIIMLAHSHCNLSMFWAIFCPQESWLFQGLYYYSLFIPKNPELFKSFYKRLKWGNSNWRVCCEYISSLTIIKFTPIHLLSLILSFCLYLCLFLGILHQFVLQS